MVLSDKDIKVLCTAEPPLISNFVEENLQGASYDVTIGNEIARFEKKNSFVDLSQESLDSVYKREAILSVGCTIKPNESILVTVQEKITLPDNLVAHIRPRSRFTRMGLQVSAQHCNPTYSGKLQLGLFNASPNEIKIVPGMKIAQIVFEELKSIPSEEKLYMNKSDAAYQGEEDFRGAKLDQNLQNLLDLIVDKLNSEG